MICLFDFHTPHVVGFLCGWSLSEDFAPPLKYLLVSCRSADVMDIIPAATLDYGTVIVYYYVGLHTSYL